MEPVLNAHNKEDEAAAIVDLTKLPEEVSGMPSTVRVKVVSDQVRYIDSLPLHDTQKLIEETPEYGIFEYYLVPTYDFRQELLSHGPDVEVLEPKELRDEIKADIALMYKNYGL